MIQHRPAFSPKSCYLLRDPAEVDYFTRAGGAPEAGLITWARSLIGADETFIDVGAHVGSWAQDLARHCERVVAFEPQRSTYERLREGVKIAGLKNVTCEPLALGLTPHVDETCLSIVSVDGGGSTTNYRPELGAVLATEPVYMTTLDRFVTAFEIQRIGLIKLDVEGAEAQVIAGARETLAEQRPTILAEAWLHGWFATERAHLIDLLRSLDYSVVPAPGWPEMLWAVPIEHV